jgi:hypothetical protein
MSSLIAALQPKVSLNFVARQPQEQSQQQQAIALLHHLLERTRHIDCAAALLLV